MTTLHGIYFVLAAALSIFITGVVAIVMRHFGIIDQPRGKKSRKIHTRPVALGGGFALYVTFFVLVFTGWFFERGVGAFFNSHAIIGLFLGSTILMIGGIIDDKYTIRPRYQIIAPIIACMIIILLGVGPAVISNLWGGIIDLSRVQWSYGPFIQLVLFADILVFFWLFGMMFTTKFLDGLDGLVAGVVAIAALVMYLVSIQPQWNDPTVAFLSIIFAGTCLGFLVWNFNPAKIFLGEGGSLMTGFILGCLAIISKSKIAVTLMVVGIPMIDVIRVIIMRMRKGKPIYIGDREHLHYRLLESGLSHRQSVFLLYAISSLFGMIALFLQARHQMIALSFLFILMLLIGLWFSNRERTN